MSSIYMTEDEQVEAIKKWWKKYNGIITVAVSLVLLAIAGYRYWNWHQDKINQQASTAYEHMMVSFTNHDNKSVRSYANQLVTDYGNTIYADAARLTLAKILVNHDKLSQAEAQLQYVADNSKVKSLQQIAKIRLARIMASQKEYDTALSVLSSLNDKSYLPIVNELRGDIYAGTGRYVQAMDAYKKAINEGKTQGMGNLFLEMKTNELASLSQPQSAEKHKSVVG